MLFRSGASFDYYYYRTSAGAEVDLIIDGNFGLLPIEIKYTSTINKRQLRPLRDFVEERGCSFGLVINNDTTPRILEDKIFSVPFDRI